MNRAMHETDGTRVCIHCGIDRFQHFYEWMLYCIKAKDQKTAVANAPYVQRQSEVLQNAGSRCRQPSWQSVYSSREKSRSTREKSVCRLQCVTDDNKGIGLSYPAIDHRDERVIYS